MSSVYLSKAVCGATDEHSSWPFAIQCTLYQLDEAYPVFESAQTHEKPAVQHSSSQAAFRIRA